MYKKINIETIKTWAWFKAMPKLMQEFFESKYQTDSIRFSREMAEEKYLDIMSLAEEVN